MIKDGVFSMSGKGSLSLMELLDNLIERLNGLRTMFGILITGSLILSPIAILLSLIILLHPAFITFFLNREPFFGWLLLFSSIGTMFLSVLTLYFSVKEYRFFRSWSSRFNRYILSRKNIEEELSKNSTE